MVRLQFGSSRTCTKTLQNACNQMESLLSSPFKCEGTAPYLCCSSQLWPPADSCWPYPCILAETTSGGCLCHFPPHSPSIFASRQRLRTAACHPLVRTNYFWSRHLTLVATSNTQTTLERLLAAGSGKGGRRFDLPGLVAAALVTATAALLARAGSCS